MRKLAVLLLPLTLLGCRASDPWLQGPTWQVTGVYTDPANPGALPDAAAGRAELIFGESTLTGSTGCARIAASAVGNKDAATVEITDLHIEDPGPYCVGATRHVHDQLADILAGNFKVTFPSDTEAVLTADQPGPDPAAIHLATI